MTPLDVRFLGVLTAMTGSSFLTLLVVYLLFYVI